MIGPLEKIAGIDSFLSPAKEQTHCPECGCEFENLDPDCVDCPDTECPCNEVYKLSQIDARVEQIEQSHEIKENL